MTSAHEKVLEANTLVISLLISNSLHVAAHAQL